MSVEVIQEGQTSALCVLFFPMPIGGLRAALVKALGPVPTILLVEESTGHESAESLFTAAHEATRRHAFELVLLAGFSAGCQSVRKLRLDGLHAMAFVFCDGAHASNPPQEWQIKYLRELAAEARAGLRTVVISHTYIKTEPAYLSTAAVARLATGWALPMPERDEYAVTSDNRLVVYSARSEALDIEAHSRQAYHFLPLILERHVRPILDFGYWSAHTVDFVLHTDHGVVELEDYVARVTTAENGEAAEEAIKAQAIAARTYVLRAMRDDPALGTAEKPIPSSTSFQVMAAASTPRCKAATAATSGQVMTYRGQLIVANYVAGAPWVAPGVPDASSEESTEVYVTYNENKRGNEVTPTRLALTYRLDNRGCMSQRGADWLARNARYDAAGILRYFYGADIEIMHVSALMRSNREPARRPVERQERRGGSGLPLAMALGLGFGLLLVGER